MTEAVRDDESRARAAAAVLGVALACGSLLLATVAAALLQAGLGVADASPVYLLAVVFVAGIYGAWPAVATSVAALFVYDFLFTAPRFTFSIANPQDWLSLLLFLLVAVVIGRLTALLRERAEVADRRSRESLSLVAISRIMAEAPGLDEAGEEVAHRLLVDAEMEGILISLGDPGSGVAQAPLAAAGLVLPAVATVPGTDPWVLLRRPGEETSEWVRIVRGHAGGPGPGGGPSPGAGASSTGLQADAPAPGPVEPRPVERYLVPIEADGVVLGSILATRRDGDPRPGRGARRILSLAADQLGIAIRREALRAELTQAEVARQSDALRAAILDSVSHELRTPLASLRATVGGLMDPGVDIGPDERRAMAAAIDGEAERLADLLRSLLDMSRVQAGALHPDLEPYDLGELVETVLRRVGRAAADRTIEVRVPPDLPPVLVDAVLFDVAVGNVLDNALRYAPAPAPLRVSAELSDGAGRVELSVDDGGPGVPPETLARLFDRFYRVDAGPEPARHGLGMGLAIARGFLEAMDATIEAGPSELGGLAVRVALPVAR